jgi:purine-nucleoside phosphorylase
LVKGFSAMPDRDEILVPAALKDFDPGWGVILGSGLGEFVDALRIHTVVPFADVNGLRVPRVAGHAARFVLAELADHRLLVAQGRVHLYEGCSPSEVTATVRLMAAAGVPRIILTNAAGSLSAQNVPGTWMMISDHLNLTGMSPLCGAPSFVDMSETYSPRLRAIFARAAAARGIALREGVYAGVLGPQYETPAEIRMLRMLGADAVGMSTVLEAIQARALGLEVAGFSCLTNWAAGFAGPLTHAEVLAIGTQSAGTFARLLEGALHDCS